METNRLKAMMNALSDVLRGNDQDPDELISAQSAAQNLTEARRRELHPERMDHLKEAAESTFVDKIVGEVMDKLPASRMFGHLLDFGKAAPEIAEGRIAVERRADGAKLHTDLPIDGNTVFGQNETEKTQRGPSSPVQTSDQSTRAQNQKHLDHVTNQGLAHSPLMQAWLEQQRLKQGG